MHQTTLYLIFLFLIHFSSTLDNNACKNFDDYLTASRNKNCFFNPEMLMETPQILRRYSSNYETHKITTEDGYVLTMFRMPRTNRRGTILFHHPLGTNSRIWISQGLENSIGLFLWNAGYDIWLSNMRGTLFSERHVNRSFSNPKFWDFSVHEIGYYDVAKEVEYIRAKTENSKIIYIGHSLGSTSGLIYASTRPEEAARSIKTFILMSPGVFFEHSTSLPTVFGVALLSEFSNIIEMANWRNLLFGRQLILQAVAILPRMLPIIPKIVNVVNSLVFGWTLEEADPTLIGFDAAINLHTASTKLVLHFGQLFSQKRRFQMFDYGNAKNLKIYKFERPPEYPLDKILVPVILISSYNDSLTTLQDADTIYEKLSNETRAKSDHWKLYGLNHIDFQIGKHKREIFLNRLLQFINDNLSE